MRDKKAFATAIGLILLIWLARLMVIDHFPPFLDEGIHVFFGERSFQVSPLVYGSQGRLFTIWWYMLFEPHRAATFWVVRTATVLGILPGAAAFVGIGKLKGGLWGGLIAGLFYLFSPYHQFYDTLALSDTLSAAGVAFALYMAYRLWWRPSTFDALVTGIGLFLAVGAKVSALVFFVIPVAAALTLRPKGRSWRDQVRWLVIALLTGLGLTAIYTVGLRVFGYDMFTLIGAHNPNMGDNLLARFFSNASSNLSVIVGYIGLAAFLFLVIALLILLLKRQYYFLLCLLIPLAAFWSGQEQSSRFFDASIMILLLCGALGLIYGIEAARFANGPYLGRWAALTVVVVWGVFQWLPFTNTMINDPAHLGLPKTDFDEYVFSDASGFGLRATRAFLQPLHAGEVIGLLSNCQGLRYLALTDFTVNCPGINPNGDSIAALTQLLEEKRADKDVYVVVENNSYVPQDIPGTLLTVVERPADGPTLSIYRLDSQGT